MLNCLRRLIPCKSRARREAMKVKKRQLKSDQIVKLLLECEKNSKVIVVKALERRKDCKERAKQAAEKELNKIQKSREEKFRQICAEGEKLTEKMKKEVESEVDKKVSEIKKQVANNKDKVIKMLMDKLVKIEPKVHRNLNLHVVKVDVTQRSTRD